MRDFIQSASYVWVICTDEPVAVQVDDRGVPVWNHGREGTRHEGKRFPRFIGVEGYNGKTKSFFLVPFITEGLLKGIEYDGDKTSLSRHLRNGEDLPIWDLLAPKPKAKAEAKAEAKDGSNPLKGRPIETTGKWRADGEIMEFFSAEFRCVAPLFLRPIQIDGRKHPKLAHRAGIRALLAEVRELATDDENARLLETFRKGYGSAALFEEMTEYVEMLAATPESESEEDDLFAGF